MSNAIQLYPFTLDPFETVDLPASGSYFRVISSSGAISVRLDSGNTVGPITQGQGLKNTDFNRLDVTDTSGAPNNGVLIVGTSEFVDVSVTGQVQVTNNGGAFSQAAAAITNVSSAIAAANAARRYFGFQNTDPIANIYLNLSGAAATVANGIKVPPGGYFELQGFVPTGAITAIADQAVADGRVVGG